jgi:hypothetical protein
VKIKKFGAVGSEPHLKTILLVGGAPNCNVSQGGLLFENYSINLMVLTLDDGGYIKALLSTISSPSTDNSLSGL